MRPASGDERGEEWKGEGGGKGDLLSLTGFHDDRFDIIGRRALSGSIAYH